MTDTIKAWQCIGCGSIEARETCIGVCEYRKAEFVHAGVHAQALVALEHAQSELAMLQRFVGQLAHITPHDDAFKTSYLALQRKARTLVDAGPPADEPARARSPLAA
jgi:hypothetical protein